jgi:hypothetical protein
MAFMSVPTCELAMAAGIIGGRGLALKTAPGGWFAGVDPGGFNVPGGELVIPGGVKGGLAPGAGADPGGFNIAVGFMGFIGSTIRQ